VHALKLVGVPTLQDPPSKMLKVGHPPGFCNHDEGHDNRVFVIMTRVTII
jgi:hypothetical protein